ncbi:MAG: glutathione S-transferase [Nannocystaceae bacterium]|nr:glutathione S-transferase [Nannocystaceae bacterium]
MIPILYSFRRCPYAIRARMALAVADIRCELREVLLRDKPAEMLKASPKGTVPVVVLADRTIDESLEIMHWALDQRDPSSWRAGPQDEARALVQDNDGPFKHHLDRYKYAARYSDAQAHQERDHAAVFIAGLETRLADSAYLMGDQPSLVDVAIFPFVRQFAGVDPGDWKRGFFGNTERWLERWLASKLFARCMHKSSPWHPQDEPVFFPSPP